MGIRDFAFLGAILGGAAMLGLGLMPPRVSDAVAAKPGRPAIADDLPAAVAPIDAAIRRGWADRGLVPTPPASELTVMRRLSLALTGSIPSLQEIRRFESRPEGRRVPAWLDELLADRRSADYLAERLARAFVGTEDGPFIVFRRRRFVAWLGDAIHENRPYDAVVRDLIAESGVWTDRPATNFLTVTRDEVTERPDPERLAARVSRAFLGVRLDCAQCHDHPFQPWKQADFRGLAAFFGGVRSDLRGIRDAAPSYTPPDRVTKVPTAVVPRVPFRPELRPESGTPRAQLAAWVVSPKNPNLARVTANRAWAMLFGRPLAEPIDDLAASGEVPPALDLLAADFAAHRYDLRRLLRLIATTEAFRIDGAADDPDSSPTDEHDSSWAAFPLARLRPEQVAGAVFQAASTATLDASMPWPVRFSVFNDRNDFVRRYGDLGQDEFEPRGGTIPQRLLLMNGDLVESKIKDQFTNAAVRIAQLAPDDRAAVEVAYLCVLTRRPTEEESGHFAGRIAKTTGQVRKERLADLYWTLLNTTEFSWNH